MRYRRILLAAGLWLGVLTSGALGQAAGSGRPVSPPPPIPETTSPSGSDSNVLPGVESILKHRAWHDEFVSQPAGYRNPGGAGLTNEFYPADNRFQNPGQARTPAHFGGGGIPDRAEQLASFNAGTARYNALQTHMDRYGRPMMGFGMGYGFGFR